MIVQLSSVFEVSQFVSITSPEVLTVDDGIEKVTLKLEYPM